MKPWTANPGLPITPDIEQLAVEPATGSGYRTEPLPDAAGPEFSSPDAHRAPIGVNYNQLPVNAPKSALNNYNTAATVPYLARRRSGGTRPTPGCPQPTPKRYGEPPGGYATEMFPPAQTLQPRRSDLGQPAAGSAR